MVFMRFKNILFFIFFMGSFSLLAQEKSFWNDFTEDSIRSEIDGAFQHFYYSSAEAETPKPLVVVLHTWSADYHQQENSLAHEVKARKWNYLHPDFRGANNHPDACCSSLAMSDIDQVITWAQSNLQVDQDSIFVIGTSGGGYAAICTFMKSRHKIRGFHAFVPIADLAAWYEESLSRDQKYALDILACTASQDSTLDVEEAKNRSPYYWNVPVRKLLTSSLHLYAGVHDGYTGSVPVTQSLLFYNKVMESLGVRDENQYVSEEDMIYLLSKRSYPANQFGTLGDRKIHYFKGAHNVSVTIFEGGHELLKDIALDLL
jgi:pimeloyl-ACP methyl ester carboxylesterase